MSPEDLEFCCLKIEGNKLYLDDKEIKGVKYFRYEQERPDVATLRLKIYVETPVLIDTHYCPATK